MKSLIEIKAHAQQKLQPRDGYKPKALAMSFTNKTNRWVKEGLIAPAQAEAIVRFEKANRPQKDFASGLLILAAFSAGLGAIALIAANWSSIPPYVKLACLFFILIGTALQAIKHKTKGRSPFVFEALLLLFMILCLGGIGLIAQIYNIKGESHQALFLWACATSGIMILSRAYLISYLWLGGLYIVLAAWAIEYLSHAAVIKLALSQPLIFFISFLLFRRGQGGQASSHFLFNKIETLGELAFISAGFSLIGLHSAHYATGLFLWEAAFPGLLFLTGGLMAYFDPIYNETQKKLILSLLCAFALLYVLAFAIPLNNFVLLVFSLFILGLGSWFFSSCKKRAAAGLCLVGAGLKLVSFYFAVFKNLTVTGLVLLATALLAALIFYSKKKTAHQ